MAQTITVMQADHVAALCTPDRVYLCPALKAAPTAHPDRIHVEAKCLVAGAILRSEIDGPYDDAEADALAEILVAEAHHCD
jgi:hypothetical protein